MHSLVLLALFGLTGVHTSALSTQHYQLFSLPYPPSMEQNSLIPTSSHQPVSIQPSSQIPSPASTPDTFLTEVEHDVLQLTNQQREENGLSPLSDDSELDAIAEAHSQDMLSKNYFSHTDASGCDGACRLTNAGYRWQAMGENIHEMWGYDLSAYDTANKIVSDWMNSPDHRTNILNASFTHAGIGVAAAGSTIYTTADYAQPR